MTREATATDIPAEDAARAAYYAVLSRLYYAGPDTALLEAIAQSGAELNGESGGEFAVAWAGLVSCAGTASAVALQQEYDSVFVGVGKALVTPYATYYLAESGREKLLVRIRQDLAALGLARIGAAREPEDHAAALFDVMRHLVLAGSGDVALQNQRRFFAAYIEPFYPRFCDEILSCGAVEFYRRVAALTREFLRVEWNALKLT